MAALATTICPAAKGKNSLVGGFGDDTLDGAADKDELRGDAGDDLLTGGDSRDLLDGGADNDGLDGGIGNDELFGGEGNDAVDGGRGHDVAAGGPDRTRSSARREGMSSMGTMATIAWSAAGPRTISLAATELTLVFDGRSTAASRRRTGT